MPGVGRVARAAVTTRGEGPANAQLAKTVKPLVLSALSKDGMTPIGQPPAWKLEGATRLDITPRGFDGVAEVHATKSGEVLLTNRFPERPDSWQQVKPEFIEAYFTKTLKGPEKAVAKPVANPSRYPSFDITPPETDGVKRLYLIGGKVYVTYATPSMPEQWNELQPRSKGWSPR